MESYNCPFPEDIITDILSRIPAVSLLSLKQVCKTWRNLLISPNFARIHLLRHLQSVDRDIHGDDTGSSKVSFLCFQRQLENPYENSIYYREYYDDKLQNLSKKKFRLNFAGFLVGSCNGLICSSWDYRLYVDESISGRLYRLFIHVSVFNPITGEELSLPELSILDNFVSNRLIFVSGFGYLPSTNEYKVVKIYYDATNPTRVGKVHVYTLGGENSSSNNSRQWRNKREIPYNFGHLNGVFINGALHWVEHNDGNRGRIIAFDLAREEFFVVKSPPNFFEVSIANNYQLCLLGGCLGVYRKKGYNIRQNVRSWDIWVLKKTNKNMMSNVMEENEEYYDYSWNWVKIFSIEQAELSHHDCEPLAVTRSGDVVFKSCERSALCIYDPKTATFRTLSCAISRDRREEPTSLFHHVNTFVSLKGMARELQET
ncbi:F-box protein At3g07870-like [Papaver somniferum]|uniref:F-box protein At3g07870-like n=1 Tax=Papaver somniferum TaxID=3469 RepID=UPI000E6FE712|nr:F-box protein At3g07870-like [Papaver somniferum]